MSSAARQSFGQRLSNRDDVWWRCKIGVGGAGGGVVTKVQGQGSLWALRDEFVVVLFFSFCV